MHNSETPNAVHGDARYSVITAPATPSGLIRRDIPGLGTPDAVARWEVRRAVGMAMTVAAVTGNTPFPTNLEFSAAVAKPGRAGRPGQCSGSIVVRRLVAEGLISVEHTAMGRVATITATGQRTAERVPLPKKKRGDRYVARPHVRRTYNIVGNDPPIPYDQMVSQDACPRCGARARSCGHTATSLTARAA